MEFVWKKMDAKIIFFNVLFISFFSSYVFSNGDIYINNASELKEKKYKTDIELIIEYHTKPMEEVYKYATATIEIISLYVDGVLIEGAEDELILEGYLFLTECTKNGHIKKRKIIEYRSQSHEWFLYLMPRGRLTYLKTYHIPEESRELKINYKIVLPFLNEEFMESKESILKIR